MLHLMLRYENELKYEYETKLFLKDLDIRFDIVRDTEFT